MRIVSDPVPGPVGTECIKLWCTTIRRLAAALAWTLLLGFTAYRL